MYTLFLWWDDIYVIDTWLSIYIAEIFHEFGSTSTDHCDQLWMVMTIPFTLYPLDQNSYQQINSGSLKVQLVC